MNIKTFALLVIMASIGAIAYNDLSSQIDDTRALIDNLRQENRTLSYLIDRRG